MAEIDKIVDVQISRETTQIETASFEIPLVLFQPEVDVEWRTTRVSGLDDAKELVGIDSKAYRILQSLFGQELRPREVILGAKKTSESYPEALMAATDVDNEWYVLICDDHTSATIKALATSIQAMDKIYAASIQDQEVAGQGDSDLATELSDQNLSRTFLVYSATADADFPEAAWVGSQLPEVAGSNTWNFKKGMNVTVSNLSAQQRTNLRKKNTNMFTRVAGVSMFQDGVMLDGSFIDEIIFIDWCTARIKEAIFSRLVNSKKIPMTRVGATIIESEIRGVLNQGVRQGGIADDTPYYVEAPDPMLMPYNDRAKRHLGDFKFEFRLAGAVHSVKVRGVATV